MLRKKKKKRNLESRQPTLLSLFGLSFITQHKAFVAVPLELLPTESDSLPMGSLYIMCDLYSHSETAHGESLWIHQKEQKNYP